MKILLIGRTGQLGSDLIRNRGTHEIIAPGRDELDIADIIAVERALRTIQPDALINTAA
ncbi:MAG: sugar nucleotide-binding protein, partial [Nitrospirota bacterium]